MGNSSTSTVTLSGMTFQLNNSQNGAIQVYAQSEATLMENKSSIDRFRIDKCNVIKSPADPIGGTVGLRVWPGALTFTDYLIKSEPDMFHNKTVVELGCGVGVPSLAISKFLCPAKVVMTDRESLQYVIEKEIVDNGLAQIAEFKSFDWGNIDHLHEFGIHREQHIDIVIGTELVYAEEQEPLLNALRAVSMKNKNGSKPIIILSYMTRSDEDEKYMESILREFSLVKKQGNVFYLVMS